MAYLFLSLFMLLQNKYQAITQQVIGCAMEGHRTPGSGFQEVIYQRSLAVEMEKAGLIFGREVKMPLFYKGVVDTVLKSKGCGVFLVGLHTFKEGRSVHPV